VQGIHRWGVEPPATPVLYVYQADYFLRQHLDFDIVDGRLRIDYRLPDNENVAHQVAQSNFTLAVHEPRVGRTIRYDIDVPEPGDGPDGESDGESDAAIELPDAIRRLSLDSDPVSPEGFRFEIRQRHRGGLFGDLFGYGRYGVRYELERDGVGFEVPGNGGYATRDAFIGWVVATGDDP